MPDWQRALFGHCQQRKDICMRRQALLHIRLRYCDAKSRIAAGIDVSLQNGQMPGMSRKQLREKDLPTLAHFGVKPL